MKLYILATVLSLGFLGGTVMAENDATRIMSEIEMTYGEYDIQKIKTMAEAGIADAQHELSRRYFFGEDVEQNDTLFFKWAKLAAAQNHAGAQDSLGYAYGNARGVERNSDLAFKYHMMAAKQGFASGMYNVAIDYTAGNGVEQNHEEAIKWYRKAAAMDHHGAQLNLGISYGRGESVEENSILAYMWIYIALRNGNERAAGILEGADDFMPKADMIEAKRLAEICIKSNYEDCNG